MRAILICNGNINSKYLYAHIKKDDFVIAVDGGANKLTKTIFTPDLIIGDMDSINNEAKKKFRKVKKKEFPIEKNELDLELAIDYCIEKKFEEIIILGAVGSRLDMNLMNVFVLKKIPEKIKSKIIHLNQETFLLRKEEILEGMKGEKISFTALKDTVISLKGFKYDVNKFKLKFGVGIGISNEFKSKKGKISFKNGLILCTHFKQGLIL